VTLLKNAAANFLRAAATSAIAVVLPLLLIVILPDAEYTAWAIIFSASTVLLFLDLGLPTSVQVLVSRELEDGRAAGAVRVTWVGLGVTASIVAAFATPVSVLAAWLGSVYPAMDPDLTTMAAQALLLLALAQATTLASNTVAAYFAGAQDSMRASRILVPGRLLAGVACVLTAFVTHDLRVLAASFLLPLLASLVVLSRAVRRAGRAATVADAVESPLRELLRFNGPLVVWGLALSVVSGLDLLLVGRFDYDRVVAFSVATVLTSGVVGLSNAVLATILPQLARFHASGDDISLRALTVDAGRWAAALVASQFLVLAAACLVIPQVRDSALYLALLGLAMTARLAVAPLAFAVVATGSHRVLIGPPILEAALNLGLSVALGLQLGAAGVALGTTVSALTAAVIMVTYCLSRVPELEPLRGEYVRDALTGPGSRVLPFGVGATVVLSLDLPASLAVPTILVGLLVSLGLILHAVRSDVDRVAQTLRAKARAA
jgi:O-antigen/teichoic acid export membrane protein